METGAIEHYEKLFPRQERLDLGAPATPDDAATPAVSAPEIPFTCSEQHRRECEARYLMKLSLEARREYYAHVREKRGKPAMRELIAEVNRQWALANS